MALLEGERYLLNEKTGPWSTSTKARDLTKKNLPEKHATKFTGTMTAANYTKGAVFKFENSATRSTNKKIADTSDRCFNSFPESNRNNFFVAKDSSGTMIARSYNLGTFLENFQNI